MPLSGDARRRSEPVPRIGEALSLDMRLYIMRHGIAISRQDSDCPAEAKRYLTAKGLERTREAARGLRAIGIQPTLWLTSPYMRAVQTGEIVCREFGADPARLRKTEALLPNAKPARLIEELAPLRNDQVICFGHAPQVDEFLAFAVGTGTRFTALKKAGVACLDRDSAAQHTMTLEWLLTSKALRSLGD
jgi:phosphohistidine phosphatase